VAATSARNAWAVGSTSSGKSLILHWNGTVWKQVPSPSPGTETYLAGVTATSAANAWAVGDSGTYPNNKTMILHWNGTAWKRVPSPSPEGGGPSLSGVAATSARNAWAVGCSLCGTGGFAASLIAHSTGTAWKQVPSPSLAGDPRGVAATSATNAWAAGWFYAVPEDSQSVKTLILRWNGKAWTQVPSPSPGAEASLSGVAATSATNAWAVGSYQTVSGSSSSNKTLILHWNGTGWK
jgi:hypothetical protein